MKKASVKYLRDVLRTHQQKAAQLALKQKELTKEVSETHEAIKAAEKA